MICLNLGDPFHEANIGHPRLSRMLGLVQVIHHIHSTPGINNANLGNTRVFHKKGN